MNWNCYLFCWWPWNTNNQLTNHIVVCHFKKNRRLCYRDFVNKWKPVIVTLFLYLVQFVEPGYTTATSSSTYANYIASRTVDGDVSQQISRCLHTDSKTDINKAWLRVDLRKTISIKSVKFWYRNDSKLYTFFSILTRKYR